MNLHFIKNDTDYIMLNCSNLKFYNINENTKGVIDDIIAGFEYDQIGKKHNISEDDFQNILKTIDENSTIPEFTAKNSDFLYKLTLNITNKCNMSCKYCYACEGEYLSSSSVMEQNTAKSAIDVFLKRYRNIKNIQFFGGEPLLNIPLIEFICEYFTKLNNENKIEFLPNFGLITNGTIYTEEMISIVNRYNILMTVSMDGNQELHNATRVFKNGSGTWQKIIENIRKYKLATNQPIAIEVTFNSNHVNSGYSIINVIKSIKADTGINNVHVVPVSVDTASTLKLDNRYDFINSVHDIFDFKRIENQDHSYAYIQRIIQSFKVKKTNKYLCEAGISMFSVSYKGDIFPCFMLTDIEKYRMGNIFDENLFESELFTTISNQLLEFSKFKNSKCTNCFNNKICFGCLGANYFNTGNIFETSEEDCFMFRKMTESVIKELSVSYI